MVIAPVEVGDEVERGSVLLVEDDPAIRKLEAFVLACSGFDVVEAINGEQALRLLGTRMFSAIVLDLNLPGMSGLDLLAAIRAEPDLATLPVLLVSSDGGVDDRVHGLRAGGSDYISKPFDPEELAARVEAQVRGYAAWVRVVRSQRRERGDVARALYQVNPEATPEVAAELVCAELSRVRHISAAAVLAFPGPGAVVPLAVHDLPVWDLTAGRPLTPGLSLYLQAQAANGPWIERFQHRDARLHSSSVDWRTAPGILACAPLLGNREPLGLLVLTTDVPDQPGLAGERFRLMSAAVDFADIAASLLVPALYDERRSTSHRVALDSVIRQRAFQAVFQPIVDLRDGCVIGYEALTRFDDGTTPDVRFGQAITLDRTIDLERSTIEMAVAASSELPPGCFLSLNVSPGTMLGWAGLRDVLAGADREIVIELTEHEPVEDYAELRRALDSLGPTKLSIDDTGSGFSSLRHILALEPEFVKLDHSWVAGIDGNPARQALVSGLSQFATQTGCRIIAEGIEHDEELRTLRRLDVVLGQGFLLGMPASAQSFTAAMAATH